MGRPLFSSTFHTSYLTETGHIYPHSSPPTPTCPLLAQLLACASGASTPKPGTMPKCPFAPKMKASLLPIREGEGDGSVRVRVREEAVRREEGLRRERRTVRLESLGLRARTRSERESMRRSEEEEEEEEEEGEERRSRREDETRWRGWTSLESPLHHLRNQIRSSPTSTSSRPRANSSTASSPNHASTHGSSHSHTHNSSLPPKTPQTIPTARLHSSPTALPLLLLPNSSQPPQGHSSNIYHQQQQNKMNSSFLKYEHDRPGR